MHVVLFPLQYLSLLWSTSIDAKMNPTTSTVLVLEQDTLFLLLRVELQLLKQARDLENSSSQE